MSNVLLTEEGLVSTEDIAARYGVTPMTVRRWCKDGSTTCDGHRVRLSCVRTPGRVRTSYAAVERFLAQLGDQSEDDVPLARTATKRAKASEAALEELRRMGV
jgi:DeoR-like helix-turn-helix domain